VRRAELSARRLVHEEYLLAVPPRHPLVGAKKPVALASIATEPFVVIPGAPAMAAIEAACASRGVRPIVALETDNLESVRRMVEAGLGVALVPRMMTQDRRRWRAGLVELVAGSVTRDIAIVHRGAGYLGAAARLLREAIIAAMHFAPR
jgi:DNA-binding transcriptional LysR family regulator